MPPVPRVDSAAAGTRGRTARLTHALRDYGPRAAAGLPGVICRGPARGDDGTPIAYLTFDDGPDPAGTPLLLDALARHGAAATFFLLGARAALDPAMARAIADAGHGVGSHGWEHVAGWRGTGSAQNMERGATALEDLLCLAVADVRPPYGQLAPALYRWARTSGRRIVLWDTMPGDFVPGVAPEVLARHVTRRLRPGSIVALHDGDPAGRASATLDIALPALVDAGWRFLAI